MSSPPVTPSDATGLGRYRVERLLGQGGMGAVYAALDTATGQRVALKRLSASSNAASAGLFEREYRTLAGLRHPCIVEVYEYGSDAQGVYYTMELLEGADLSKQAPMPWREVCACLRDAASILGVLHARQLVHRDLSPRNLWRTRGGRLKLLDFGALAPFGPATEVVGTLPFMAPETLTNQPLDARTDMFALGALGYWLLTGVHAFATSSLGELQKLHQRTPAPPSRLVRWQDSTLEPPPPELDALIGALLRIDPRERPGHTEELIDRLQASAEIVSESHEDSEKGYLESSVFVGRRRERERADELLQQARVGSVRALLVEGEPGIGRTRFLHEVALSTRVAGAVVVSVDASVGARPYGVSIAIASALLAALPTEARRAAAPHADVLRTLSDELASLLSGCETTGQTFPLAELRFRRQTALEQWLIALARVQPLALLVDDVHAIDNESQSLLAGLAHSGAETQLLIVTTGGHGEREEVSPALLRFRAAASRLHLVPLTGPETLQLLSSVFGRVPYLERLSERLYSASAGNPAHCLELAQHLVKTGLAHYREGSWTLPSELRAEQLPKSRREAQLARLDALSADARSLGQQLSISTRTPLLLAHCLASSDFSRDRTLLLLAELCDRRILRESEHGFSFAHDSFRHTLESERDPARTQAAHLRLAVCLAELAGSDRVETLRAGVHFLHGGDVRSGHALVRKVVTVDDEFFSTLGATAALHEQAYGALCKLGAPDETLAASLATLAIASYFAERSYASRYGDRAVATLERLLRLDLARRLKPYLGKTLSLVIALLSAGVWLFRRRPFAPSLVQAIQFFLAAISGLVGTFVSCIDPLGAARHADKIEPLKVLGKDHAASIVERFSRAMVATVADRPSVAFALLSSLIVRLRSQRPVRDLPLSVRNEYVAGLCQACGITACWRDGPDGLAWTEELNSCGPMYRMNADQLRASYYASQGDMLRAEEHRKRVEGQAVKLGSSWQVETWSPADATKTALRTNDALVMKRAAGELARLSREVPSLELEERHARGTYLVLRGKYAQAIPLLDTDEEPLAIVGWARTRGTLARAYNGLGRHEEARDTCRDVLARLTPEDLQYPVMNLNVSIELALAEAGLGNFTLAEQQIASLIAQHAPHQGPLTLGSLHEARARVALAKGDLESCRVHLDHMASWYRPTGIATLLERVEQLERALSQATRPDQDVDLEPSSLRGEVDHLMTRVHVVLAQGDAESLEQRGLASLQVALELSGANEGLIVLADTNGRALAHLGGEPSTELVQWVQERLDGALTDDDTILTSGMASMLDASETAFGSVRFRVTPLVKHRPGGSIVFGMLALGFHHGAPQMLEHEVLHAIVVHLARAPQ